MKQENINKAKKLLNQIIDVAKAQDEEWKRANMNKKGDQCIGDSWLVYHLRNLKDLMEEE